MYIPSCSSRTLVYKGLMAGTRLADFYLDLQDPDCESRLAVFHQRYSTNTMPDWRLAQPFRLLAHNGEINTLGANRAWMRAREAELEPELRQVVWSEGSDSASLDNALEPGPAGLGDVRGADGASCPTHGKAAATWRLQCATSTATNRRSSSRGRAGCASFQRRRRGRRGSTATAASAAFGTRRARASWPPPGGRRGDHGAVGCRRARPPGPWTDAAR